MFKIWVIIIDYCSLIYNKVRDNTSFYPTFLTYGHTKPIIIPCKIMFFYWNFQEKSQLFPLFSEKNAFSGMIWRFLRKKKPKISQKRLAVTEEMRTFVADFTINNKQHNENCLWFLCQGQKR